jgi:hypothetical protein
MPFSGYQDFQDPFADALQQMIAARPGISINSGYRSPERQAELYAQAIQKYGSEQAARRWVAPPGKSRHNHGIAADLAFATDADRQWAHENAAQFGLNFRMGHEPWHIELIGGKETAVGNHSGEPVAPPGQVPTSYKAPQEVAREDQALYSKNVGPVSFQSPIDPVATQNVGIQDVNALASLISPRRQGRARGLLENIREFS